MRVTTPIFLGHALWLLDECHVRACKRISGDPLLGGHSDEHPFPLSPRSMRILLGVMLFGARGVRGVGAWCHVNRSTLLRLLRAMVVSGHAAVERGGVDPGRISLTSSGRSLVDRYTTVYHEVAADLAREYGISLPDIRRVFDRVVDPSLIDHSRSVTMPEMYAVKLAAERPTARGYDIREGVRMGRGSSRFATTRKRAKAASGKPKKKG